MSITLDSQRAIEGKGQDNAKKNNLRSQPAALDYAAKTIANEEIIIPSELPEATAA
jgi:hypothetical protein